MKVFIDMDGVLVDFIGGLFQSYNIYHEWEDRQYDWNIFQEFNIDQNLFWKKTSTVEWWANLNKTDEADDIIETIKKYIDIKNICILTSPGNGESSSRAIIGKQQWIEKHYPEFSRQILYGMPKYMCASPGAILIDDSDKNCKLFNEYGGKSILFSRSWNSNYKNKYSLDHLAKQLCILKMLNNYREIGESE